MTFPILVAALATAGASTLRATQQQTKLTATGGGREDLFGAAVAVDGGTVVIGAPEKLFLVPGPSCDELLQQEFAHAYIFTRSGNGWMQEAVLQTSGIYTQFGAAVAVSGDTVVVGAPGVQAVACSPEHTGAAYVYVRSGGTWTLQASSFAGGQYGAAVALAGNTLVVGAPGAGTTSIYTRSGTTWTLSTVLSVAGRAVGIDGTTIVISPPGPTTSVYVFTGGQWLLQATLAASGPVSISGDTVLIGGTVWVRSGSNWTAQATLAGNVTSVAVRNDTAVFGSPETASVYSRAGTNWRLTNTLAASDGAAGDEFGKAVATNGTDTLVGAWKDDIGGETDQGSVWAFTDAPPPLTSLTLTADRAAPQPTQTTITFTATAVGGAAPAEFQWWFYSGVWSLVRDWSASPTYTWTPAAARSYYYWAVYGRSAGSWATPFELVASMPFPIQRPSGLALKADFDSGGTSDILWRNRLSGDNTVWLMNGLNAPMVAPILAVSDTNWEVKGVYDFDGDGTADVLWRNKSTGSNSLWFMNGTTLGGGSAISAVPDLAWEIKGVGDFNGDGRADILWRNASSGANVIWLIDGASLLQAALLPSVVDTNWEIEGVADFSGDHMADILWRHRTTGENSLWLMSGVNVAAAGALYTVTDLSWEIKGIGDFNGDGKADVLWRRSTAGENSLWLMDGLTVSSGVYLLSVTDLSWEIAGTGDFDGDGMKDILWRRANGENALWLMNGAGLRTGGYLPSMATTADPVGPGR